MAYESIFVVCTSCVGVWIIVRMVRLKTLLVISILIFSATVVYRTWEAFHAIRAGPIQLTENVACRHPNLDTYNEQIARYIRNVGKLKCDKQPNWLETRMGHVYVNMETVRKHGNITCKITYLSRVDDYTTSSGKTFRLDSRAGFAKLESDFFTAQCSAADGATWRNIMAGVARNETVVAARKRIKPPSLSMKLNVLIFGMDSLSRMHFMRKLPMSYEYLTEVLNATVLKGYNIVGDGTPQALVPIFTGMAEPELPETRFRMPNAHFVNIYPFAWNDFASNGYVTAYGEDMSYVGTFTYRMKGFDEQPTDHYMRPFYVKAETVLRNHPKWCLRGTPRHRVMLDYLRQFFDVYSDMPKFAFLFHSELSHDDYNTVGYVDPDLENFLRGLNQDGILNSTLLIVMSDHGHRFATIRETQQGKEEERLPFFSITVPPWLEKVYPDAVRNLRINENRLTTPFDIYSTLMSVLYSDAPVKGDIYDRSISLFSEVPLERSCKDADIEPHWCTCLEWEHLSPSEEIGDMVGQSVIDYINDMTRPYRDLCAALTLDEVKRLQKLLPNEALLRFNGNADLDGFEGKFDGDTMITEVRYEVQVLAGPSQALYEATVRHDVLHDEFIVDEPYISRVNSYSSEEHCIHDELPSLGKYCFCNDLL